MNDTIFSGAATLFTLLFCVFLFSLWIWSFVNIIQRRDLSLAQKMVWIGLGFFFTFFGSAAYAVLGKPRFSRAE